MRRPGRRFVCWSLLVALVAGCGNGRAGEKGEAAEKGRAPAEDGAMCEEHGVLEAICTKCNPKLIPVFQAKGDWCEEHGFPESVCPICHPERGGKPATDTSAEVAPADGTKVRFKSKETSKNAGIKTVKAEARQGGARLTAVVTISYDATKRAEVNARSPGVVRALKVDVGTKVKTGAPLAVIESAEVGADRSRLQAASARVRAAEQHLQREKDLAAKGISSRKEVIAAEQELEAAKADYSAAAASLGVIGKGAGGAGGYQLAAPIAGVVTRRAASVGHMVDLEEVLFEIVDTSTMWAEIDIPETELGAVSIGQEAAIAIDGMDGREFKGTIEYIAPEIDPHTRTAKARVALPNPDGLLRANMFGKAQISLGAARATVMVPRASIQRVKTVELVFVKLAEDEYETRRVKTGMVEGDLVEVVSGIKPGEDVATEGSFLLKTETLKGSIGAGCCE